MGAPEIRFLTDPDLFPLCRALRMLGFDTLNRGNLSPSQAIQTAIEEHRLWVRSSSESLNLQYGITYFIVSSLDVPGQLDELDRHCSLKDRTQAFSRCLKDNGLIREIPKEEVGDRAPEKILQTRDQFFECPMCKRVYWHGSHLKRMAKKLEAWGWSLMTNDKEQGDVDIMDKLYQSLTPDQQREDRKLRTLQNIVDSAGRLIVTGQFTQAQAKEMAQATREAASRIIPDQMDLYDIIYGARFRYWIEYFCTKES